MRSRKIKKFVDARATDKVLLERKKNVWRKSPRSYDDDDDDNVYSGSSTPLAFVVVASSTASSSLFIFNFDVFDKKNSITPVRRRRRRNTANNNLLILLISINFTCQYVLYAYRIAYSLVRLARDVIYLFSFVCALVVSVSNLMSTFRVIIEKLSLSLRSFALRFSPSGLWRLPICPSHRHVCDMRWVCAEVVRRWWVTVIMLSIAEADAGALMARSVSIEWVRWMCVCVWNGYNNAPERADGGHKGEYTQAGVVLILFIAICLTYQMRMEYMFNRWPSA